MKLKYIIAIFIFGTMVIGLGALLKLESWPMASEFLIIGSGIQLISLTLGLIYVLKSKNSDLN